MALLLVCCEHITSDTEKCFRETINGVDIHRCLECVVKFRRDAALWVYRLAVEEPMSSALYSLILQQLRIPEEVR